MTTERGADQPQRTWAPAYDVAALRRFAGAEVRIRLSDGAIWSGRLRTDLLTERSISVYVCGRGEEGATLYIDQIEEIVVLPTSAA
ncbi:MAG: hypothetical protein NVS4B13_03630 [Candidatus Elarobacter sp.]